MITKQSDLSSKAKKKNIQIQEEILPIIGGLRLYSNQKGKEPQQNTHVISHFVN